MNAIPVKAPAGKDTFPAILIIGPQDARTERLCGILRRCAVQADRIDPDGPGDGLAGGSWPMAILRTAAPRPAASALVDRIKQVHPGIKVAVVCDQIHPVIEIGLRAMGLVFLGTEAEFDRHAASILASVLRLSPDEQATAVRRRQRHPHTHRQASGIAG